MGDGENRLICLDYKTKEMKVFKGTSLESTKKLQGVPVCVQLFNPVA